MPRTLLIVDDDLPSCRLVRAIFNAKGFEVAAAHDSSAAMAKVASERPDLVLLDVRLGSEDGLEVLQTLKAKHPHLPVVMLTAHGEVRLAVRATQLGAFDFLPKPFDHDELVMTVRRALSTRALELEVERLRRKVDDGGGLATQMGPSVQTKQVIEQVRTVAPSNLTVLILGETGTGKELIAQAIHRQSDRSDRAFVALDCGAIPEALLESELFGHERGAFTGAERRQAGRFEIAEGGTLFLDEIANLPFALQAKFLRVLESRQLQAIGSTKANPIDVRFIAATNSELQQRVSEGAFRADLYFRLAQYSIALFPLRDRPGDIRFLALRFLEEASIELRKPVDGFTDDALELLECHSWPGNVRELKNVVRQAVLQASTSRVEQVLIRQMVHAPTLHDGAPSEGRGQSLKEVAEHAASAAEKRAIIATLQSTRGNKSQAAKVLRTDYKTLHLKMKKFGIRGRDFSA